MQTATIETISKMLETLPEAEQKKVAEHLREYIENLKDEMRWDESFERTSGKLSEFAEKARREIKKGKSEPMSFEKL